VDDPAREHALSRPSSQDAAVEPVGSPIPDGLDATVVFVRHGESTFIAEGRFQGQADPPLTAIGQRQAALVAARLAAPHDPPALPVPTGPPVELVHSPLGRTTETAAAIETALARTGAPTPRRADPGFLELHQGAWQGLHRSEIAERYGAELAAWRRAPLEAWAPGGESIADVATRVRPALTALLAPLAEGRARGTHDRPQVAGYLDRPPDHPWSIVVAHDGVFKIALLTLFDLPLERFWMWSMDLCGITIVELRAGRAVLRAHDLTAHLVGLEDETARVAADERARSGGM
jgi:broad specificity phosphatase PhoE